MATITIQEAEEILYDKDRKVAYQEVSSHRWYTKYLVVFLGEHGLSYGFYHLSPSTEEQEGMDEFESDPVEIFRVKGNVKTIIEYEKM